jgi:hypothetical protein
MKASCAKLLLSKLLNTRLKKKYRRIKASDAELKATLVVVVHTIDTPVLMFFVKIDFYSFILFYVCF